MEANYLPLWKTLETPFFSLSASHVEMFSLLLLFGLTLVALLVRRRRQLMRHLVQTLSIAIFFYIVYSCLGVFGMIRNALYGLTLLGTVFTEAFFWMSLPVVVIAFSLTTGPYFCGWICPTGTFQELAAAIRERLGRWIFRRDLPNTIVRPSAPGLLLLGLFFVGFVALVMGLSGTKRFYVEDSSLYWAASLILLCFLVVSRAVDDAAIRTLRAVSLAIIVGSALLKTMIVSPVHFAFADVRDPASALTTLVLVVAALFVSRAWCRYICPWGYLMGCVHRISRLRVQPTPACTACGRCDAWCRVGAIRKGQVQIDQCQFCLACVDRCPQGAMQVVDTWRPREPGKP